MRGLAFVSLAIGTALSLTAVASAQSSGTAEEPAETALKTEDEIRCDIEGICKIKKEKKFEIANIRGKAKQTSSTPSRQAAPTRAVATPRPRERHASIPRRSAPAQVTGRSDMLLTFNLNSAQLTPRARAQADIFANYLRKRPEDVTFLIEGHTDSIGSRDANLDLSRRRAESVVAYLVERGIPEGRLRATGFAFDRPRNGLPASHPDNRRVEIVQN